MNVVIIGLGYVGLPLAQEAVRVGLRVTGLDVKQATVDALNAGRRHVDDLTDADVAAMSASVRSSMCDRPTFRPSTVERLTSRPVTFRPARTASWASGRPT